MYERYIAPDVIELFLKLNYSKTEIKTVYLFSTNQNTSSISNLFVHPNSQGDLLFDICTEANNNHQSLVPDNSYAIPFIMLLFILLPEVNRFQIIDSVNYLIRQVENPTLEDCETKGKQILQRTTSNRKLEELFLAGFCLKPLRK